MKGDLASPYEAGYMLPLKMGCWFRYVNMGLKEVYGGDIGGDLVSMALIYRGWSS